MEILTKENILKVMENFDTLYPRSKIPQCAKMDALTKLKLCAAFVTTKQLDFHSSFLGLPLYVDITVPPDIIRIYNLDDELMHEIKVTW